MDETQEKELSTPTSSATNGSPDSRKMILLLVVATAIIMLVVFVMFVGQKKEVPANDRLSPQAASERKDAALNRTDTVARIVLVYPMDETGLTETVVISALVVDTEALNSMDLSTASTVEIPMVWREFTVLRNPDTTVFGNGDTLVADQMVSIQLDYPFTSDQQLTAISIEIL